MATIKAPEIKWILSPTSESDDVIRGWPTADYLISGGNKPALRIDPDGVGHKAVYNNQKAKTGNHLPLTVSIAAYENGVTYEWLKLKNRFLTLDSAKDAGETAIASYQEFWPLELRQKLPTKVSVVDTKVKAKVKAKIKKK